MTEETNSAAALALAGNATCPVGGEPIDPAVIELVDGKPIGFCCEDCRERFRANPEKFSIKTVAQP